MTYDARKIESKGQKKWVQAKLFEPAISMKKKFFYTIPYPYTSGPFHIGHGRTYAYGDVATRWKRLRGFNVLWPMGFHITGTPVLAVCQKIVMDHEGTMSVRSKPGETVFTIKLPRRRKAA